MNKNYGSNNLHALVTFGEVEAIKRPGLDIQARIDSTAELLIVIRADLKNKYGVDKCTDLGFIKDMLMPKLRETQDKVDLDFKSNGLPYMENEKRNEIIGDIFYIRMKLMEIAAREDLFDKTSIPSGAIPDTEGTRRLKPGAIVQ